jgi:hypothetical protein
MNKVRAYCLLLVLLVLMGWAGSYTAPVQAIGPFSEGLASSEPEEHPVDRIEAAKVAGKITPDEAALYKLYAFTEPDKLPSQFQFPNPQPCFLVVFFFLVF